MILDMAFLHPPIGHKQGAAIEFQPAIIDEVCLEEFCSHAQTMDERDAAAKGPQAIGGGTFLPVHSG
jgi:hypothetical protein